MTSEIPCNTKPLLLCLTQEVMLRGSVIRRGVCNLSVRDSRRVCPVVGMMLFCKLIFASILTVNPPGASPCYPTLFLLRICTFRNL
jgi:hypothetical protein